MSFVVTVPETVSAVANELADIGSAISSANAAAALPTTGVVAAAADEISAAIASIFGVHAQGYQALSSQAAAFHEQFVRALAAGATSYAAAEAASASPLQALEQGVLSVVNAPTQALLGRPIIGNGANGTSPGQPGGAGGLLFGNGGNGAAG
ncbi:PE family protein, partial [Mycobacterium szulgai]